MKRLLQFVLISKEDKIEYNTVMNIKRNGQDYYNKLKTNYRFFCITEGGYKEVNLHKCHDIKIRCYVYRRVYDKRFLPIWTEVGYTDRLFEVSKGRFDI